MADLYEVLIVEAGRTWHAGFVVDDESETDVLLRVRGKVPLFGSRAGVEHLAQEQRLPLLDDLPDEIDLDLGGWLSTGTPQPTPDDVLQLWHLLLDDPTAGGPLAGEVVGEAYDDLVEQEPTWFSTHGDRARTALRDAVRRLSGDLDRRE